MDASSLILSLPSSISGAVDFGQRIHYAREFRLESSDAATQLRVLTWHLDEWKRSVGITEDGKLKDEHDEALDYPEVLGLVEDHMRSIQEHRRNLERRLLKLGVEVSSKRKALKTIPGNRLLWKPEDGREKPPLPTPKGISWGFGRDKLVRNELDSMTRAIDDLFKLVPPKASPLEKQAEETMKVEEERRAQKREVFEWLNAPKIDQQYDVHSNARLDGTCGWIFDHVAYRTWISELDDNPSAVESIWQEYTNSSNIGRGTVASQAEVWKIWKQLLSESPGCTVLIDGFDEFDRSYRVQSKFLQKIKQVSAQTTTNILVTSRDEEDIQDALSSNPRGASEVLMLECFVSKELVKKDLDRLASEVIERQLHSKPDQVKIDLASRLAERSDGMFLWITQQSLGQLRPGKPLRQLQQIVDKMPTGLKETYRKKWNEINGYDREDQERTSAILRLVAFALRPLTVAEITEALLVKQYHDNLSLDGWPDEIDDEYIKGEIKGLCGSLIHIRSCSNNDIPKSRTLHLAHASVKEFLLDELRLTTAKEDAEGEKLAEHHTELAKICLRYLTYPETWVPSSTSNQGIPYAFLDYASEFWERHVLLGDETNKDVSRSLDVILHPETPAFRGWRASRIDSNPSLQPSAKEQAKKAQGNPLVWASQSGLKDSVEKLLFQSPELLHQSEHHGETALHVVCRAGSLAMFTLLLEKGADVDVKSTQKQTPLSCAVLSGNEDLVSCLLDAGADINSQDESGRTPICHACMSGSNELALLLLEKGADQTIVDNDRLSPLYGLCKNGDGDPASIMRLLENGADATISLEGAEGATCLHACAEFNRVTIALILLERGAQKCLHTRFNGQTPLHIAASKGHRELMQILIDHQADVNQKDPRNRTPLHTAARHGHLTAVALLLDNEAEIEVTGDDGETPLHWAAVHGHLDVTELLLDRGANRKALNKYGWSILHYAAIGGLLGIVTRLIDSGIDPDLENDEGFTPLHFASVNGHVDVVKIFLQHSRKDAAFLEKRDDLGRTALYAAALSGQVNVVAYLLDQGAGVKSNSIRTWEPLHAAAFNNHPKVARLLIDRGADLEVSTNLDLRPLQIAAAKGHLDMVQLLLERGARVSARNRLGLTPLTYAADEQHEDVVRMLLKHEADPTLLNSEGKSAVHYAASRDSTGVLRLLLDAVSDFDSLMDNSWSPLNCAAWGGNTEILRIFLEKRPAEYFKPDFERRTALHMAARGGKLAAFEMLLASGFEPSARDARGRNILHYASMNSSAALIEKILQLPCSADLLKQESYFTPLHWAARGGDAHVVAALIAAGVQETSVKTNYPKRGTKWTPWALAKFFNNEMLLSETKSPFTLRDNSPGIGTSKERCGFICDSCEREDEGLFSRLAKVLCSLGDIHPHPSILGPDPLVCSSIAGSIDAATVTAIVTGTIDAPEPTDSVVAVSAAAAIIDASLVALITDLPSSIPPSLYSQISAAVPMDPDSVAVLQSAIAGLPSGASPGQLASLASELLPAAATAGAKAKRGSTTYDPEASSKKCPGGKGWGCCPLPTGTAFGTKSGTDAEFLGNTAYSSRNSSKYTLAFSNKNGATQQTGYRGVYTLSP
ncbi:hypothetical protein SLS55_001525 [Diplodia seriata]|uniref:GPI inositol-deacylase winged helix domain-containing protein n=1 Tax=Diplodia seriata TaxID=420778 RepID=A0ABR3CPI5_9PEZI